MKRKALLSLALVVVLTASVIPTSHAADRQLLAGRNDDKYVVATSMSDDGHAARKAVDGKKTLSRWSTSATPAPVGSGLPQAIQIDMGASYELHDLKTYWFGDGRTYTFDVYVTDEPTIDIQGTDSNGKGYGKLKSGLTPVATNLTGKGYGKAGVEPSESEIIVNDHPLTSSPVGRYLTINVTACSGNNLAVLWEVEAYGDTPTEKPTQLTGDLTGDGACNIADLNALKNLVLSEPFSKDALAVADFNQDGKLTVIDLIELKHLITPPKT